jgi:hypothetical protein
MPKLQDLPQVARMDFLVEIIDTSPDGVVQILEFTMHTLRWEGVRRALENLQNTTTNWNEQRTAERILEAWEDDWGDAELYDYYRTPDGPATG